MIYEENKFGSGWLYESNNIVGTMYVECAACMSILSEFLSFANTCDNRFCNPSIADNIIVLSCQVTDLAVLNDIKTMERLIDKYPNRKYFVGGCLSRRFDIELPDGVGRIDNFKKDGQFIFDRDLVKFQNPFWVKAFDTGGDLLSDGHLFRDYYPLRISVGCKKKCKYCTIRDTRGKPYSIKPDILELFCDDNIVLISDSPSKKEIEHWCRIAMGLSRKISFRNIEPLVAVQCKCAIINLAQHELLDILHIPIQTDNKAALKDMWRPVRETLEVIEMAKFIKTYTCTTAATNVIIDYKNFLNPDIERLYDSFDYISWNPYWDGVWNRELAEKRFAKYIK